MSRETDRLIADRGYGLTRAQQHLFRGVVAGEIRCNLTDGGPSWWAEVGRHVHTQTLRALERRGLIERPMPLGDETEVPWRLTRPAGFDLAWRLGLIRADTDGSPGDLYDDIEHEIQMDRRCGDL